MKAKAPRGGDQRFSYYMDLLSHDVLNNNQAVLGYLELILASEGIDRRVRKFAEKAVSHIRTSTILVDNVKRQMVTREMDPKEFKPTDLAIALNQAEREVVRMFPDKRLKVRLPSGVDEMRVIGDGAVNDLVLNMLVSVVRLDPNETIELRLRASEVSAHGKGFWQITLEDPTAQMPLLARDRPIEEAYEEDRSIAVKMVGILYCRMMALMLGGSFEVREMSKKAEPRGAVFVATLLKEGKP